MKEKLVLIGNGMAGVRALEELFKHNTSEESGSDLYDITVIGSEPHPNYNRIMLSPVLAGEKTINEIILNSTEWYEENNISLITGDAAKLEATVPGDVVWVGERALSVCAERVRAVVSEQHYNNITFTVCSVCYTLPPPRWVGWL